MTVSNPATPAANVEQAEAWNGDEGEHWTRHADAYDRAGGRHWQRLMDAGLVDTSDAVLDIGCGTGKSTRDVARVARRGSATGIDLSAVMLALARERTRADGLTNANYVQADAQVHRFDRGEFQVAISSFGAMFFEEPVAAFANIARGLAPGATLALLAWRDLTRNEWLTEIRGALAQGRQLPVPPPDAPTPFALADPHRVTGILNEAGFDHVDFEPVDEPIDFGPSVDEAFNFLQTLGIVRGLSHGLDDGGRARALADLRLSIDAHHSADGVLFGSAAWLITAERAATVTQ